MNIIIILLAAVIGIAILFVFIKLLNKKGITAKILAISFIVLAIIGVAYFVYLDSQGIRAEILSFNAIETIKNEQKGIDVIIDAKIYNLRRKHVALGVWLYSDKNGIIYPISNNTKYKTTESEIHPAYAGLQDYHYCNSNIDHTKINLFIPYDSINHIKGSDIIRVSTVLSYLKENGKYSWEYSTGNDQYINTVFDNKSKKLNNKIKTTKTNNTNDTRTNEIYSSSVESTTKTTSNTSNQSNISTNKTNKNDSNSSQQSTSRTEVEYDKQGAKHTYTYYGNQLYCERIDYKSGNWATTLFAEDGSYVRTSHDKCTFCNMTGICPQCKGARTIYIYPMTLTCTSCAGSGYCGLCYGKGYRENTFSSLQNSSSITPSYSGTNFSGSSSSNTSSSNASTSLTCPNCHGSGKCSYCSGKGGTQIDYNTYKQCSICNGTGYCHGGCHGTGKLSN